MQTKIKIRIHKSAMDRVLDFCAYEHFSPDGNEHYIVNFPFIENEYYYNILFSFGDKCECLEPLHIRTEMKRVWQRRLFTASIIPALHSHKVAPVYALHQRMRCVDSIRLHHAYTDDFFWPKADRVLRLTIDKVLVSEYNDIMTYIIYSVICF